MAVLIRTLMLVPETDNDAEPFSEEAWRELEDRLMQFGGCVD